MNNYQKSLVEEHSQLVIRIDALHNYIYSEKSDKDNKVEFANKCIQLASMKKYEEALSARLANANILFENNNYYESVGCIMPKQGSDYDLDDNSPANKDE